MRITDAKSFGEAIRKRIVLIEKQGEMVPIGELREERKGSEQVIVPDSSFVRSVSLSIPATAACMQLQ